MQTGRLTRSAVRATASRSRAQAYFAKKELRGGAAADPAAIQLLNKCGTSRWVMAPISEARHRE